MAGLLNSETIRNNDYQLGKKAELEAVGILARAWELEPANRDIAVKILKVFRQRGDRENFEKWYNNILLADPGNLDAFANKRDLLHSNGNIDDLWAYAEELINKGGLLVRQVPQLVDKIGLKLADNDSNAFFDFIALHRNERSWNLISAAYKKYNSQFPEDKSFIFEYANYAAYLGFWEEAHKLFTQAGDVKTYKGRLTLGKLKERILEAKIYAERNIVAPKPNHLNFNERGNNRYQHFKESGIYNFWQQYQKNNEANDKWDPRVKEVLNILEEDWCTNPEVIRDYVNVIQKSYTTITKLREEGNKDPLLHMLWAQRKDSWYKEDKSASMEAVHLMLASDYPANMKFISICNAIKYLGYQKTHSEKEKAIAIDLVKKLPDYINKQHVWPEQFYNLFYGLQKLKLLSKELAEPIINKYKEIGKLLEHHMAAGHFNNRMAWYTHSLSKKKNWKLIHQYNRQAKASMKKAWLIDPLNPYAAETLYRYTDSGQDDYVPNLRRALYTNNWNYGILKKFMNENSHAHGRTIKWAKHQNLLTQIPLLHYRHAEDDAVRDKNDPDIREDHWSRVSQNFENYLQKFPNDSINRSRYALYAIKCNKNDVVKTQLKALGKYAVHWVFGSEKKLKEYQEKYLKE